MLKKKQLAMYAVMILCVLTVDAGDFFKKQSWKLIKESPKPTPVGAQFIPEIKKVPAQLENKINAVKEKGVKLDFVTYPNGQKTRMKSIAYLCYDRKNLYVVMVGEQSDKCKLKENHHKKETAHIWYDDNFELFVDPFLSRNEYMHLIINPLGEVYDAKCFLSMVPDPKAADQSVLMPKMDADMEYSANAEIEALKGQGEWSICVAIPFAKLGIDSVPLGQPWGFNFCHTNREIDELSQWKVTSGGLGFHTPSKYGVLIFGDKKPPVKTAFTWDVAGYGQNILDLKMENPASDVEASASIRLIHVNGKNSELLKKSIVIAKGKSSVKLPFEIPFTVKGKVKISAKLAIKGVTVGYFIKNIILDKPVKLTVPLTQIYTSDKAIKGTVRLNLGVTSLENSSLKFSVKNGDKIIKNSLIKSLPGNYMTFGINTSKLKTGTCWLEVSLVSNGKTLVSAKEKLEVLESPFPF